MLNFIDLNKLTNYQSLQALHYIELLLFAVIAAYAVIIFLSKRAQVKNYHPFIANINNIKNHIFMLMFFAFLAITHYSIYKMELQPVDGEEWAQLAQAESTLLQIEAAKIKLAADKTPNKPSLGVDPLAADAWIIALRNTITHGSISYKQYVALAKQYNALQVGIAPVQNYFATNTPEAIRKSMLPPPVSEIPNLTSDEKLLMESPELLEGAAPMATPLAPEDIANSPDAPTSTSATPAADIRPSAATPPQSSPKSPTTNPNPVAAASQAASAALAASKAAQAAIASKPSNNNADRIEPNLD